MIDRFDVRGLVHIFGGPFAGKTTFHKEMEDRRPGLVIEFDDQMKTLFPEVQSEWRNPKHPRHMNWMRANESIKTKFDAHRKKGGITLSHDPTIGWPPRQQVWLFPGHDVIRARKADWVKTAPLEKPQSNVESRIRAADHWYAKAAQRDYANKFTQMDGARLMREILKLGPDRLNPERSEE